MFSYLVKMLPRDGAGENYFSLIYEENSNVSFLEWPANLMMWGISIMILFNTKKSFTLRMEQILNEINCYE